MPRIRASFLRQAHAIDSLLPPLLGVCRTLGSAQNELRWLREHVDEVAHARRRTNGNVVAKSALLRHLVRQRASGKPLQYVIGSEWFGDVLVRCREGVLIPRQDTAASVSHLVRLLRGPANLPSELRVLDLCTGTGCIPFLVAHDFNHRPTTGDTPNLHILGVDVSDNAIRLALHNLKCTRGNESGPNGSRTDIQFMEADILLGPSEVREDGIVSFKALLQSARLPRFWDVLISNPPYISPREYWTTTTRSVRGFEPKIALVPPNGAGKTDVEQGDAFYKPLLEIAHEVGAKIVLLEIADQDQAERVACIAQEMAIFDDIEIWRDQPGSPRAITDAHSEAGTKSCRFPVVGQGNARSVFCYRGDGTQWLQRQSHPTRSSDDAR